MSSAMPRACMRGMSGGSGEEARGTVERLTREKDILSGLRCSRGTMMAERERLDDQVAFRSWAN
jgi:hypothetical protein